MVLQEINKARMNEVTTNREKVFFHFILPKLPS
jgi:hypothetical protein